MIIFVFLFKLFLISNAEAVNLKVPEEMVLIPEGNFIMGISPEKKYLSKEVGLGISGFPEHKVYLPAYLIDKYEATIKEYREFAAAVGNKPPTLWMWNPEYPQFADNYPVIGINWYDADAYCRFKGKRLPTEAEWEKAARGTDGRIYPWGNDFDFSKCNVYESKLNGTQPVDSFPDGKSPYGVYNMCGNAMEWTDSWFNPYLIEEVNEKKRKAIRGGSWDALRRPFASTFSRNNNTQEWAFSSYGVRCVKDIGDSDHPFPLLRKEGKEKKTESTIPLLTKEGTKGWLEDLVLIPAGEFEMGLVWNIYGSMIAPAPAHKIYLDDFYLTNYEITNQNYAEFVEKTGASQPPYWNQEKFNKADQPVSGINWFAARDYCAWKGWRLPTEAEWEKAASWDGEKKEKIIYPWGNDEVNIYNKVNFWYVEWEKERGLAAAGSFKKGATPAGVYDLSGSVWEWVEDWYNIDYYNNSPHDNPSGPDKGEKKVLRGGSWGDYGPALRPVSRGADYPKNYYSTYGIRCAKSGIKGG